jgi:putative ABC transport system permease protein
VGRRIQVGQGSNNSFEVVGVVEDTKPVALGGALQPPYAVYASVLQFPPGTVDLLVRPRAGQAIPEPRLLAALNPVGTVTRVMTEEKWWAGKAAPLRWFANALWIGGAMTLIMAIFGTGAAMHLWVAALMPELAMRRAVGARRRDVMIHVLSRAAIVGVAGVAVGLVLNDLTSAPLAALVPGVPAIDVAAGSRLGLVLLGAALAGALLPAWRASRSDPAVLAALLAG